MTEQKKKSSWLGNLANPKRGDDPPKKTKDEVVLQPALRQLGTAPCPVCQRETAVFLTRTNRPFQNCGYCSARVFFNGHESMRLLKRKMKAIEPD
jgi:DNA-directed RNA polymerase subunit RPC12/RpoP